MTSFKAQLCRMRPLLGGGFRKLRIRTGKFVRLLCSHGHQIGIWVSIAMLCSAVVLLVKSQTAEAAVLTGMATFVLTLTVAKHRGSQETPGAGPPASSAQASLPQPALEAAPALRELPPPPPNGNPGACPHIIPAQAQARAQNRFRASGRHRRTRGKKRTTT
ncbi:hypothetical protein GCM10010329_73380 [Streptomyces spiroverticillatus]|uniref:Uncharacterized protein n=1 Tax=Streptomyces finlayi TaxID=67296 RepID=A0A919CEC5_9ACTN|nr:hypothetical protein GCM10010329_73380 [Streptomyces spiroverticillatus]GHD14366.1 hypothetical protein GCM10010334_73540 [Streptomyces finlayi]